MSLFKANTFRWLILLLCLMLGTWFGIFMQSFAVTAPFFRNVVDFAFDLRRIDLVVFGFGFYFSLKLNLGTLIGAVIGIFFVR